MSDKNDSLAQYRLFELKLEVTHRCSLHCVHCSSEAGPNNFRMMSLNDAVRIVDEASQLGVSEIAVSGGEPAIWEGILQLIESVAASGMKLSLYSSGVGDQAPAVITALKTIPNARLILSLFSHLPEMHDSITQRLGSHNTTMAAINKSVKQGTCTELHFTAFRHNYKDLPSVCDLAKSRGVNKISVLRVVPQGRSRIGTSDLFLQPEDNLKLQSLINKARSIIETRVGSPYGFLHVSDTPQCRAGVDRLIVQPELEISPCDAFKQVKSNDVVGNDSYSRLDKWSLSECWQHSPYLRAIRQYLREPHVAPCCDCELLPHCFSGCTAQRYIAKGKLLRGPDPMCLYLNGTEKTNSGNV